MPIAVTLPEYTAGGRIAFQTDRDGDSEIYVMGCDGQDQVNLTNDSAEDKEPSWGIGGQLVFSSDRNSGGGFDIYLLTLDPWQITRLTTNAEDDESPVLSPDGSKVAYVSYRDGGGDAEVYVLTISDRSLVQITDNTAEDKDPAWSSDGTRLAFASNSDGDWDIYLADADGSNPVNLTDSSRDDANGHNDRWPDLGADYYGDELITFSSDRDGDWELYTMYDDGVDPWQTTSNNGADTHSSWGASVEEMVFQTDRDTDLEVYFTFDGGGQSDNLSGSGVSSDSSPDWEPLTEAVYCGGDQVEP